MQLELILHHEVDPPYHVGYIVTKIFEYFNIKLQPPQSVVSV